MAKAVLGPEEQPEDIVDETDAQAWEAEEPDSVPSEADPSDEQHCGKLRHTFHLRREFQVEIDLPADLTENEARRLAAFVQLLAID
ncbi:MAG: hypothetical protein L6R30_01005 [Thermoanaerobaculia bacterium]|nr:hypothetical protein [Thermoanaerobaculia bacterium]